MGAICTHAEAWTEFWQDQEQFSGCCANAPEILTPVHDHWCRFASMLPASSHVLDLGCGNGAAGRALLGANPSLHVTGVDFATVPASCDPRMEIRSNTRIESLPFADGSFAAAVSQFGFEYGSLKEASSELARVLGPGAPISLLVHHARERIAIDSIAHRGALEAICGAALEVAFLSGSAIALDRQLGLIRYRFPHQRIIDEAAEGLRRHIGLPPAHRAEIWQAIKAALAPELVMLADLEAASVSPEQMPRWLQSLSRGFELQPPSVLKMTTGHPLCWKVEGICRAVLH